jgi:hypothetical protein
VSTNAANSELAALWTACGEVAVPRGRIPCPPLMERYGVYEACGRRSAAASPRAPGMKVRRRAALWSEKGV